MMSVFILCLVQVLLKPMKSYVLVSSKITTNTDSNILHIFAVHNTETIYNLRPEIKISSTVTSECEQTV